MSCGCRAPRPAAARVYGSGAGRAREGPQQRLGEREQPGDGGQRVAGQADEVLVLPSRRASSIGWPGRTLTPSTRSSAPSAAQDGVDVVDGSGGGAAGGDDEVGVGARSRPRAGRRRRRRAGGWR